MWLTEVPQITAGCVTMACCRAGFGEGKLWGFSFFATCNRPFRADEEPFPDGRAKVGELHWVCWHVEKKFFVMPLLQSGIHGHFGHNETLYSDMTGTTQVHTRHMESLPIT